MGKFSLGGGKEGSSMQSIVRLDSNGREFVSFFNDLET
jgi:hypothetical protein